MPDKKYSMSFTSATLLYHESITIAALYYEIGDWNAVRDKVVSENLLQMRTLNASKRICREAISRLKLLTQSDLKLLIDGSQQEQKQLLWLAVCRRYRFIYDFAAEVVREKFLRFDFLLTYDEYDIFFNDKAEWHPEVEDVASSTREKQRQIIFKMLREAQLLSNDNQILPALLTPRLAKAIAAEDPNDLTIYPASELDIRSWLA